MTDFDESSPQGGTTPPPKERRTYSNVSQFPHLAGMDRKQIREVLRRALRSNPGQMRLLNARGCLWLIGLLIGPIVLLRFTRIGPVLAVLFVTGLGIVFLRLTNVLWANRMLFRITREEIEKAKLPATAVFPGPLEPAESNNPYQSPVCEVEPPPYRPLWKRFVIGLLDKLLLALLAMVGGVLFAGLIIAVGVLIRWLQKQ
jgi:hypothetical protein